MSQPLTYVTQLEIQALAALLGLRLFIYYPNLTKEYHPPCPPLHTIYLKFTPLHSGGSFAPFHPKGICLNQTYSPSSSQGSTGPPLPNPSSHMVAKGEVADIVPDHKQTAKRTHTAPPATQMLISKGTKNTLLPESSSLMRVNGEEAFIVPGHNDEPERTNPAPPTLGSLNSKGSMVMPLPESSCPQEVNGTNTAVAQDIPTSPNGNTACVIPTFVVSPKGSKVTPLPGYDKSMNFFTKNYRRKTTTHVSTTQTPPNEVYLSELPFWDSQTINSSRTDILSHSPLAVYGDSNCTVRTMTQSPLLIPGKPDPATRPSSFIHPGSSLTYLPHNDTVSQHVHPQTAHPALPLQITPNFTPNNTPSGPSSSDAPSLPVLPASRPTLTKDIPPRLQFLIPVQLPHMCIHALADTGSTFSLINAALISTNDVSPATWLPKLRAAAGAPISLAGIYDATLVLESGPNTLRVKQKFFVVPRLTYDMVLGLDILYALAASFDFSTDTLTLTHDGVAITIQPVNKKRLKRSHPKSPIAVPTHLTQSLVAFSLPYISSHGILDTGAFHNLIRQELVSSHPSALEPPDFPFIITLANDTIPILASFSTSITFRSDHTATPRPIRFHTVKTLIAPAIIGLHFMYTAARSFAVPSHILCLSAPSDSPLAQAAPPHTAPVCSAPRPAPQHRLAPCYVAQLPAPSNELLPESFPFWDIDVPALYASCYHLVVTKPVTIHPNSSAKIKFRISPLPLQDCAIVVLSAHICRQCAAAQVDVLIGRSSRSLILDNYSTTPVFLPRSTRLGTVYPDYSLLDNSTSFSIEVLPEADSKPSPAFRDLPPSKDPTGNPCVSPSLPLYCPKGLTELKLPPDTPRPAEPVPPPNINPDLTIEDQACVRALLCEYEDVFASTYADMKRDCIYTVTLQPKDNAVVTFDPPFRMSPAELKAAEEHCAKLLAARIITPICSQYNNRIFLVKKPQPDPTKPPQYRLLCDMRRHNSQLKRINQVLPRAEDLISRLANFEYLSKTDMMSGYFQIQICKSSINRTAFFVGNQQYAYTRCPQGGSQSMAHFTEVMNKILQGILFRDNVFIYVDDVWFASHTVEEHLTLMRKVFDRFRTCGVYFNSNKCQWLYPEVDVLGSLVSKDIIRPNPARFRPLAQLLRASSPRQAKLVYGFFSFHRRSIFQYAIKARPIQEAASASPTAFSWGEPQQNAVRQLHSDLLQATLFHYQADRPTRLECDASLIGLSASLYQSVDGKFQPLSYWSRQTKPSEMALPPFYLEAMAVVSGLIHFRAELQPIHFTIVSDCQGLLHVLKFKNPNSRMAKIITVLSEFSFDLIFRSGSQNSAQDTLSRLPDPAPVPYPDSELPPLPEELLIAAVHSEETPNIPDLAAAQATDNTATKIRNTLFSSPPDHPIHARFVLINQTLYERGNPPRPYIPPPLRPALLSEAHDSLLSAHLGVRGTIDRLQDFYWHGKKRDVITYVKSCLPCAKRSLNTQKFGQLTPVSDARHPYDLVGIDIKYAPKSSDKFQYLLICTDYFTRFTSGYPCRTLSADELITNMKTFFLTFGMCRRISADAGSNFISTAFKFLLQSLGTSITYAPLYHHEPNGLAEAHIKRIGNALTALCCENIAHWNKLLPAALLAINSSRMHRLSASPFELLYGFRSLCPRDIAYLLPQTITGAEKLKRHFALRVQAQQNLSLAQYDRKRKFREFRPNQRVLVFRRKQCKAAKYLYKYIGPVKIKRRTGLCSYLVKVPVRGKMKLCKYHLNQLKPFIPRPKSLQLTPVTPLQPVFDWNSELYQTVTPPTLPAPPLTSVSAPTIQAGFPSPPPIPTLERLHQVTPCHQPLDAPAARTRSRQPLTLFTSGST